MAVASIVRNVAVLALLMAGCMGPAHAVAREVIANGSDPFAGIPAPVAAEADSEELLPDDACMQELRRCCCCPNWTHYAIFDMLFLQRNNQAGNAPLAYSADTGLPVITTQDMQSSIGTGFRAFYGELFTDRLGWEIGYTGIYGMFGSAKATGPTNLELPQPLGLAVNNFNGADSIRTTYLSNLQFAEFNIFCYDCCEECGPNWCRLTRCKRNCHCINWMAGFIWAGLDEQSSITALCCDPPEPASYNVRTS
ncbi:MAG: hypothetical protein ACK6DO_04430, partial [Planctomycetia bacterium]